MKFGVNENRLVMLSKACCIYSDNSLHDVNTTSYQLYGCGFNLRQSGYSHRKLYYKAIVVLSMDCSIYDVFCFVFLDVKHSQGVLLTIGVT